MLIKANNKLALVRSAQFKYCLTWFAKLFKIGTVPSVRGKVPEVSGVTKFSAMVDRRVLTGLLISSCK